MIRAILLFCYWGIPMESIYGEEIATRVYVVYYLLRIPAGYMLIIVTAYTKLLFIGLGLHILSVLRRTFVIRYIDGEWVWYPYI